MKSKLLCIILIALTSCTPKHKSPEEKALDSLKEVQRIADSIQFFIRQQQIFDSIDSIKMNVEPFHVMASTFSKLENFSPVNIYSMDEISRIIDQLREYSTVVVKYEYSNNDKVASKAKQLRKLLEKKQKEIFPRLRKEYARIIDNKMWEHDIDVTSTGTSITFIGGIFAANKNKSEFHSTVQDVLSLLRFKRANYKWYKYDDEYTYYSIPSPADTDLVY